MSKPDSKVPLKIFFHKNESPKRSSDERYESAMRAHSSSDKSDTASNKSSSSLRDIVFLNMEHKKSKSEADDTDSEMVIFGRLSRRGGETLLKGIFPDKPRKNSRTLKRGRRGTEETILSDSDSENGHKVRFNEEAKNFPTDDNASETSLSARSKLKRTESIMEKDVGKSQGEIEVKIKEDVQESGKIKFFSQKKGKRAKGKEGGIMHEKIEPEIVTWLFRDMGESKSSSSGNSGNCECCKSDYKNENSKHSILDSASQYSEIFLKVF